MKPSTCLVCFVMTVLIGTLPQSPALGAQDRIVKKALNTSEAGPNLLRPDVWNPWHQGFTVTNGVFLCDNGQDSNRQAGLGRQVVLNQQSAQPIMAEAWSRADNVGGTKDSNYALYIDLIYTDGTPLWGQTAAFNVGTHDWEKKQVIIYPEKPVRSLSFYLLLRNHAGKH